MIVGMKGVSVGSRLIRWFNWGDYNHVAWEDNDTGECIESWRKGVTLSDSIHVNHTPGTVFDRFRLDTTPAQEMAVRTWLLTQVGKGYDWGGILHFITRPIADHDNKARWFCSELIFAAYQIAAGINILERIVANRVYPSILIASPLLKPVDSGVTSLPEQSATMPQEAFRGTGAATEACNRFAQGFCRFAQGSGGRAPASSRDFFSQLSNTTQKGPSMYLPKLIPAANSETFSAVADLVDIPAASAANSRVIEGRMTVPYGLWPTTITNTDGKPEKVLQRLDKAIAGRLVSAFNSMLGKLSRFVGGSPIYAGHPDYRKAKDPAAWKKLGKCVSLEAGESALIINGDFSDIGKALVAANEALAPSPHWGLEPTSEKKDDLRICEPCALYSVGLTPRPNIKGAAINEEQTPAAPATPPPPTTQPSVPPAAPETSAANDDMTDPMMAEAAQGIQVANVASELAALASAVAEKEACILALKADNARLCAELETLRTALQNSTAGAAVAACNSVLDAATAAGRLLPADREHWRDKLTKTPAAANELFAASSIKTESEVDAARVAAANEAMGNVPASTRFASLVQTHMAEKCVPFEQAWNSCKATHAELYKLMPNGGRA